MYPQTLLSVLIWVAVIYFIRAVSDDTSESHKSILANRLNILVRHSGWRSMDNVNILKFKDQRREVLQPVSVILEALSSGREPIDGSNVMEKYKQIWTVLKCRYAEVLYQCRSLVQHLIRVCRNERRLPDYSFGWYFNCFNSLLVKLQNMSPRFKCMTDALDFFNTLTPQRKAQTGIIVATQRLTDFTFTLGPRTSSTFSERGIHEESVDHEIKNISEYFMEVFKNIVNGFVSRNCNIPSHKYLSAKLLYDDFEYKRNSHMIPVETTLLEFVENEIDRVVDDIFTSCFYNLGFAYDDALNVTIRTN